MDKRTCPEPAGTWGHQKDFGFDLDGMGAIRGSYAEQVLSRVWDPSGHCFWRGVPGSRGEYAAGQWAHTGPLQVWVSTAAEVVGSWQLLGFWKLAPMGPVDGLVEVCESEVSQG